STIFYVVIVHIFIQAEDGIRDFHVTGVQTCARPISLEAAVAPFGEMDVAALPFLPLLPLLAAYSKDAVAQRELDILLAHARQLGRDLHGVVALGHVHLGHHEARPERAEGRPGESRKRRHGAEEALEHALHLGAEAAPWIKRTHRRHAGRRRALAAAPPDAHM